MPGFPKLVPAFSIVMQTAPQLIMGQAFSNSGMAVGPIEHGTMKSVSSYGSEPLEGEIVNAADVFHVDASFRAVRLDFRSVIKPSEGHAIFFSFQGFIDGNEDTALILKGDPAAISTKWGSSCIKLICNTLVLSGTFDTGNLKWKHLTNKVFVGAQRLIVNQDKPLTVEINLSEVVLEDE